MKLNGIWGWPNKGSCKISGNGASKYNMKKKKRSGSDVKEENQTALISTYGLTHKCAHHILNHSAMDKKIMPLSFLECSLLYPLTATARPPLTQNTACLCLSSAGCVLDWGMNALISHNLNKRGPILSCVPKDALLAHSFWLFNQTLLPVVWCCSTCVKSRFLLKKLCTGENVFHLRIYFVLVFTNEIYPSFRVLVFLPTQIVLHSLHQHSGCFFFCKSQRSLMSDWHFGICTKVYVCL